MNFLDLNIFSLFFCRWLVLGAQEPIMSADPNSSHRHKIFLLNGPNDTEGDVEAHQKTGKQITKICQYGSNPKELEWLSANVLRVHDIHYINKLILLAAWNGHIDVLRILQRRIRTFRLYPDTLQFQAAIFWAAWCGHIECVEFLFALLGTTDHEQLDKYIISIRFLSMIGCQHVQLRLIELVLDNQEIVLGQLQNNLYHLWICLPDANPQQEERFTIRKLLLNPPSQYELDIMLWCYRGEAGFRCATKFWDIQKTFNKNKHKFDPETMKKLETFFGRFDSLIDIMHEYSLHYA